MTLAPLIDVRMCDGPVTSVDLTPWPREAGGECVFLGRTRQETHPAHGTLILLHYDAYAEMAVARLRELAAQAMSTHGALAVRIHHAIGDVPVGAASVLVQVAAGHRAEAFDACRFLIDALKKDVPIWKQERWADGTTWSDGAPVAMPESSS
ncbi:MAG: molybdenum cofactor biosynthesis protein MoaE [Phycisphaerales bacterium]|nr:molybdenum cofactor biosynthesis protein MoaE [Phycisphaerales bacterium]